MRTRMMTLEDLDKVKVKMSPQRRELMMRVMNGDQRALPLLFHIQMVRHCDDMLRWLVSHGLTGSTFVEWFQVECDNSPLTMTTKIVNKMEAHRENRAMLLGHDFI